MMNKTYLLNSSIIVSIFLFFILILPQSVFGLTNAECAESCNPYDAVSNPGSCVVTSYSCSGAVVSGTVNEGNGWCHDTYSCSGYVGSGSTFSGGYVNGTSGCTCEANGPSCQIVGSFSGGSTSGPSYQCGGGGGGGGVSCNNNGICDAGETNNSCASDCPIVGYTVSVTPLTRSILNGQSTTYFITLNPTNSTDLNNLGVYTFATPIAGCPSGATCTYSGNDTATMRESYNSLGDAFVEPTSINVTIVTSAVTPGTYPLTFSVTKNGSTAPAQSTTADLIINPGSVPTVDIKGWGNAVPQASPTDGPITMNSGTSGGLVWTSTNATNCVISRNGTNLGNFAVNSSAGVGPLTSTQTHSIVCTGPGGTSNTDSFTHTVNAIPNLTSGAVTPITATAGTPLTFSSIITNNGSGSTGASFPNFFQVATAINGGGTITDLVSSSMPTLAAAGTNTATSPSYTFGSAGTYSVRACTDKTNSASAGVIAESNEADNCGSWTTITVSAVGATACPSGTPYISSKVLGTLRNDYSGWVGTKILIGSSSRTVTALGRIRVAGNSGTHTVKLVNVATGVDVSGGSVSVDASSGTAGQYVYTSLASPLTLAANTEYYVVSQETNGGDQWYNDTDTQVFPGSEGTIPGAVYGTTGAWNFNGVSNRSYIPVDLCTTGVITPITIGSFNPFYTSITNFPTVNNNTVYWTTTGNPTSCVASGSSPWGDGSGTSAVNASLATGSHYQGVYPGVGNYTYTLTCSKAGVSDVTAAFSVPVSAAGATQYNLTVNKTIGGSVTSIDGFISCGSTCTRAYNQGTVVTLQAVPDSVQWRFVGWGGACSGTGSCVLTVDGDKTVTAQFKPRALLYQEF